MIHFQKGGVLMGAKLEELSEVGLHWYNHVKAIERNREPAVVYCKRHNIKIQTLYDWKHEFYKTGILTKSKNKQIKFQKLTIQKPEPATVRNPVKIHFPNGIIIEMQEGFSDSCITALLKSWK